MVVPFGPILDLVNEQGGVTSYVLAVIFAPFTVGRHRDPPVTWWGPMLGVGFLWVMAALTGGHFSDYLFTALLYGGAWGVGYALRQRARRISELDREAQDLRERQAEREQQAIAEERGRIARELHDIVSHSISVITIQAQAVRRRLHPDQTSEIDDLQDLEDTARQAMAEMRRLLGVLRADGPAALAPQPGLEQLGRLVADTRAAGVAVDVRTEGEPAALAPGLDLAAYRVVQEALTNCRKHAAGASTAVVIRYDRGWVELRIENDAGGAPVSSADGGHGLIGMRERVAPYGGTLEAGPRPDGGFVVRARLPRRQETTVSFFVSLHQRGTRAGGYNGLGRIEDEAFTLEVLDAAGNVVQTYTGTADEHATAVGMITDDGQTLHHSNYSFTATGSSSDGSTIRVAVKGRYRADPQTGELRRFDYGIESCRVG